MAKRDMTEREFKNAAFRNQFALGPLGLIDKTADHEVSYGYVFERAPFRILRRTSLARALRGREKDETRRAALSKES